MGLVRKSRDIIVDAAMGWLDNEAMTRGAAIGFYTIFALAPFVILVTAVAGLVIGREVARDALMDEVGRLIGREAVTTFQSLAARSEACWPVISLTASADAWPSSAASFF